MNVVTRHPQLLRESRDGHNRPLSSEHDHFLSSMVDRCGNIIDLSDGLCGLMGYERGELIGQNQSILLFGEKASVFLIEIADLLEPGRSWRGDLGHVAKDGHRVWFDCLMTPIYRRNEAWWDHIVVMRTDISASREISSISIKKSRLLEKTGRAANVGGWELDLCTDVFFWTEETYRIYGLASLRQPSFAEALSYFSLSARDVIGRAIKQAALDGMPWRLELPLTRPDGREIWVRLVGEAEFFCGKPRRIVGAIQDITETVSKRHEVERLSERISLATQSGSIGVWEYDSASQVLHWDEVTARQFGYDESRMETTLAFWFSHIHLDDLDTVRTACLISIAEGRPFDIEFRISKPDGEIAYVRVICNVRSDYQSSSAKLVGVIRDITETRRLAAEMKFRLTHDELTGLLNRSAFEERVSAVLGSRAANVNCDLLNVDLDQFKLVNDTCGHSIGDVLLKRVALLLTELLQPGDVLARLGSDEFALLTEGKVAGAGETRAAVICRQLDEFRFLEGDRRFRISASIGVVPQAQNWEDILTLIQAANTSCAAAKEEGRNRFHIWSETDKVVRARRGARQWASRIEQALDDDRFALFGQLITPIAGPVGPLRAEILVRMVDHDGSFISPGLFIHVAEQFHLASRVDRWVFKRALMWLIEWSEPDSIGTISVNLSGQSVGDSVLQKEIIEHLRQAGPDIARKICFEITETAAITNLEGAAAFMAELRTLGVRIALDDFGSGTSSFGYLRNLPIDFLKIDGQFIRDLKVGSLDEAAVRCFIDVARLIGVKTVAECIETQEVFDRLLAMGVDYGQGFLMHRPVPIEMLIQDDSETNTKFVVN